MRHAQAAVYFFSILLAIITVQVRQPAAFVGLTAAFVRGWRVSNANPGPAWTSTHSQDGTSNYLKGLVLLVAYVLVSAGFFWHKDTNLAEEDVDAA